MYYSAALLEWSSTELNQLDVKFRKLLSMNGAHFLKADINRLCLLRHLVGRGLYLCWMLLSVRNDLYHIIYMVLHNLYYAVQRIFYKFRLWVGKMIMLLKHANNSFSNGKVKFCMVNS